jgi:hypothetical protein
MSKTSGNYLSNCEQVTVSNDYASIGLPINSDNLELEKPHNSNNQ